MWRNYSNPDPHGVFCVEILIIGGGNFVSSAFIPNLEWLGYTSLKNIRPVESMFYFSWDIRRMVGFFPGFCNAIGVNIFPCCYIHPMKKPLIYSIQGHWKHGFDKRSFLTTFQVGQVAKFWEIDTSYFPLFLKSAFVPFEFSTNDSIYWCIPCTQLSKTRGTLNLWGVFFNNKPIFDSTYEAEFIQKLLHEKKKSLAVVFNSTFRYIDDVLSINNRLFRSYVDSIYSNELEIKDTTECSTFASYLDVSLKLDTNGKITTQLYDKRDDFIFSIVNFPYLCSNIPASPAYGVIYIAAYSICKSFSRNTISF
jgi:hypothetical protein